MAPALAADASRFAAPLVRWSVRAFAAVGVLAGVALATIASGAFLGTERVVERVWQDFEGAHEQLPPSTWWAAAVTGLALIGASVALWRAADFAAAARRLAVVAGTLVVAVAFVYMPFTETASAPRPFLETVKARIGDGWLGDYGGTDFAANWVCERTVVPYVPNRREAERVLRETPGRVYFVLEAVRLPQKGLPEGTRVLLEDPRKSDARLVLIGRE
jgi:hypothetical protein